MPWGKISIPAIFTQKRSPAPPEHHAFIELRGVTKTYESPSGGFQALKGVDLQVEEGEFMAIAGKSGSGKSTLLNMLTGIDRPTSGEIHIQGVPIHKLNEEQLTDWRGGTIGIVFQFFQLIPTMTLIENVMLPMDFCGKYSLRSRREQAAHLLDEVDLNEFHHRLPAHVSGGQQQRAAVARALANDPPILIADEPTGNLDSASAEAVFNMLRRLNARGKTVIIVTHDQDLARACHRILHIADGRIVGDETIAQNAGGGPIHFRIVQQPPADCGPGSDFIGDEYVGKSPIEANAPAENPSAAEAARAAAEAAAIPVQEPHPITDHNAIAQP